jgi:hypothetical protein
VTIDGELAAGTTVRPLGTQTGVSTHQNGRYEYRVRTVSRSCFKTSSPNSHGSRRCVSMCACARKNGWNDPA